MKAVAVCLLATLATLATLTLVPALAAGEETFTLEPFGTLTVYRSTPRPAHVVLFISGDGGWKLGVVDMARELASMWGHPDQEEGPRAFAEKRDAVWLVEGA